MRNKKTSKLVLAAIFLAIIFMLAFTPGLGYIPLGTIRITTIHIPVILGGIILGPTYGAVLGGAFGLTSFINNTIAPVITSFVFTPFYSLGEVRGSMWSLVICFLPRILIGVVAYYVFTFLERLLKKRKGHRTTAFIVSGIAGSLTNTVLVMNLIYLFFGKQYAVATNHAYEAFYGVILGVIGVNGIPEAIGAAIVTAGVGNAIYKLMKGLE